MRQIYETAANREQQRDIAAEAGRALKATMLEMPPLYPVDYLAVKPADTGWSHARVEIKRRDINEGQYPDIMLSLSKLAALKSLAKETGFSALFIVQTNYAMLMARPIMLTERDYTIRHGGRTKHTRDQWDVEQVAHIPMALFQELERY